MAKANKDGKKKGKKKSKLGPKPPVAPKPNPFDSIWSRRKFDILGKKRRGEERRVGLARSKAIEKRKRTLLKEYEQSTKASVFVDKRIGERNDELGEFDKAILRSQRQRQLKLGTGKKSKYNLSDGEEDDFDIAGPLSGRDDFEDEVPLDDDDWEAAKTDGKSALLRQLSASNAQDSSVADGEEDKPKSKKEVMEELIMKSKFFKAQKAKDKEENEQLMEELDKNFTSLVQSQVMSALTEPSKMNALKALVNKDLPEEHVKKDGLPSAQEVVIQQEKPDSYDKLVKEMALDMRARPSDRTKTPEEIAHEERERLEKLEEERRKRMHATDESSDEDKEDDEKSSTQKLRSISGDDLGDSFSIEEERGTKKGWVDEILERRDAEGSESEENDSSEESESEEEDGEEDGDEEGSDEDNECKKIKPLEDWEQSDDEDIGRDLDEEGGEGDHIDRGVKEIGARSQNKEKENVAADFDVMKMKGNSKQSSIEVKNLPGLIEAPKDFDELCKLLENRSNDVIIELIRRIRVTNAIKLAAENRKKIQVFYGLLLQYFAVLTTRRPLNFELLNLLVKALMEMSAEIPYFAAVCARQRIRRTRIQFCEAIKNSETSCWPSLKTLLLLRLWSMIFPCSDFRHAVMTPVILVICEYLIRSPISSGRDIAIGSFLCSMLLNITKQSWKFCPEAIIFLRTLLMAATDRKEVLCSTQFYHLMELKVQRHLLRIQDNVDDIAPLNFFAIMSMPEDSTFFSSDSFRAGILLTVIETLQGFVECYEGLNSFPELFLPISALLLEVAQEGNMPDILKEKLDKLAGSIQKKADESHIIRRPLQMRKKKPVPIKLLNPKFEENFVKGRDYDPDRDRAEMRKLKKLIKREAKGAARELRKDNYFLYEVKAREKAHREEEKAEQYGKARAFLQEQEHAFKSGQLGRSRKRRR